MYLTAGFGTFTLYHHDDIELKKYRNAELKKINEHLKSLYGNEIEAKINPINHEIILQDTHDFPIEYRETLFQNIQQIAPYIYWLCYQ